MTQHAALPALHPLSAVAEKYQLPLRGLWERARRKEFTHVRIGKERYLTDDQLAAFIASMTVTSERAGDLAATRARRQHRRRPAA